MSTNRLGTYLLLAAGLCGIIDACSLTVPPEADEFGKYKPTTGGVGGVAGGSAGAGMSTNGGGHTNTGGNGTNNGGMHGIVGGEGGTAGPAEGGTGGDAGGDSAGGEAGASEMLPPAVLLIHYTFDDLSTLVAKDSSGHGKDGTLTGSSIPITGAGHIGNAIQLVAAEKQYVALPGDILDGLPAVSVASWLKLDTSAVWDRLFDFNAGSSTWFYFSPTGWNFMTLGPGTHIAVTSKSHIDPEMQLTEVFPVGSWHHVAVVWTKPYLRYYLDGALKSEITNMTLSPSDVGKTYQNWIGRSVFMADPYLNGMVDDFRVYSGALTATEVAKLSAM